MEKETLVVGLVDEDMRNQKRGDENDTFVFWFAL